jgi:YHS domain-containing protein
MRKSRVVGLLTVALVLGFGVASVHAQAEPGKPKQEGEKKIEEKGGKEAEQPAMPLCPVSGEPIDFGVSIMTDDGPVYFCCPKCMDKYKADPKKFAEKLAGQRKALAAMPKIQVTCPVSGKPIDKKVSIEKDGKKVYFCCEKCPAMYEKDPAKYAAKLAGSYTYQTKCPVTGRDVNPNAFITLEGGMKIYFCCSHCFPKFETDTAKCLPKLKEQGITLDPAKIKIVGRELGQGMDEEKGGEKAKEPGSAAHGDKPQKPGK